MAKWTRCGWVGMFVKFDCLFSYEVHILRIHKTRNAQISLAITSCSISFRLGLTVLPLLDGYLPFCALTPGSWWSRPLIVSTRECSSCSSPHLTCLCCVRYVCMIYLTNNRTQSTTCTCPITGFYHCNPCVCFSLAVAQTVLLSVSSLVYSSHEVNRRFHSSIVTIFSTAPAGELESGRSCPNMMRCEPT